MRRAIEKLRTACWIALFCAGGMMLVKLTFVAVCWIGGHNWTEALFGFVATMVLGGAVGVESYMWFRDRRLGRLSKQE